MTDKEETLSQIEQYLSALDELFRDVTLDSKYVHVLENENAELRMENEQLKRERGILPDEKKSVLARVEAFRYLEIALVELTLLRQEREKEERLNEKRAKMVFDAHDALSNKMTEVKDFLQPLGRITGLYPKYVKHPGFDCYVLVSD